MVTPAMCDNISIKAVGSSLLFLSRQSYPFQIKSKLLAFGAVSTTINDQGYQHMTRRFESIRVPLNKSTGWPTFVQSHLSVKTDSKINCHLIFPPIGREKISGLHKSYGIAAHNRMGIHGG